MKGSIKRYCTCKDAAGKQFGVRCPKLALDSKHGLWELRDRLPTTTGIRPFRRRGMSTKTAASKLRTGVYEILDLSKGDRQAREKLGDLIFSATDRGGQLPDVGDVRRRLGLGLALDRSQSTGEWLTTWVAGKKRSKKESTADGYDEHVRIYLVPILGDIPLDRLNDTHISDMFDLIEERNTEIELARIEGRRPVLEGDTRRRKTVIGATTQRRIFATLRNALNAAYRARRIDVNPCDFVELAPDDRHEARTWSPEQVGQFLDATQEDRLYLLYRLVLLAGLRRGEVTGLRWADIDLDERVMAVTRPLLSIRGRVVEGTPKSNAGSREVSTDPDTTAMLRKHRTQQKRDRLAWGEAYEDNDLVFCREDGSPIPPDYVSRHFRELIERQTSLPRIKLHEGRHTAATLMLEAKIDIKIVSARMGHSTEAITRNLYQHVRRAVDRGAADAVLELIPKKDNKRAAQ